MRSPESKRKHVGDGSAELRRRVPASVTSLVNSRSIARGLESKRRAERGAERVEANLSPVVLPTGTPARSETQITLGAKERSAMRTVALDWGGRKICYCEIADGKVVLRETVGKLEELADVLGAASAKARVAIEACRET